MILDRTSGCAIVDHLRYCIFRQKEWQSGPAGPGRAGARGQAHSRTKPSRTCGDYPDLARGDVNLYSLFVERAFALLKPESVVGLLTPSGIASDKTASSFFRSMAMEGLLRALYDFENKKVLFPDVHASFKFCVFVAGRTNATEPARCAFYLHDIGGLDDEQRCFPLAAEDFARVNPNTGSAPIFRSRRDADSTMAIYERLPVLVDRPSGSEARACGLINSSSMSARSRGCPPRP